jgi:hypothetical protein
MKLAIVLASIWFSGIALAADPAPPRVIDMTVVLTDLRGKPIVDTTQATVEDPQCARCGPLTLGTAVALALLTERKDEPNLSAVDKAKRGILAMRLLDNKAATLTGPETALIDRLVSVLSPMVVARVIPLIDPTVDLSK